MKIVLKNNITLSFQLLLSTLSFLFFYSTPSFAQNEAPLLQQIEKNTDSLAEANPTLLLELCGRLKEISLTKKDKLLEAKSHRYQSKALYFLNKMEEAAYANLACAQTLENSQHPSFELTAECYLYSGLRYWDLGIFDLTKELAQKGIGFARKSNNSNLLVRGYDLIGQVYFRQGDYEKALMYYDSCYQIDRQFKDTFNIVGNLGIIGRINTQIGRREGIKVLKDAIELIKDQKQTSHYSMAVNALGLGYANLNDFKNAKKYILEGLTVAEELKDTHLIINRYINLGDIHTKFGYYEAAERYLLKSLSLMKGDFEPNRYVIIHENLGEVYRGKKQYQKAIDYHQKALVVAEKGNMLPRIKEIYQGFSNLYKENKNFEKALFYNQKYKAISDSIFTLNAHIQANALKFKYESVTNEASITKLESENALKGEQLLRLRQQRIGLFGILSLLGLVGSLGFLLYRQKQQQALAIKQERINQQIEKIDTLQQEIAIALDQKEASAAPMSIDSINQLITSPLTEREFEILQLIVSGNSNKEVAAQLFVSVNTVKFHLKNIYAKLDVKNRVQAVQLVLRK